MMVAVQNRQEIAVFYDRAKRIDLNKLRQSGVQMRYSPRKKPLEIELVYVQRL